MEEAGGVGVASRGGAATVSFTPVTVSAADHRGGPVCSVALLRSSLLSGSVSKLAPTSGYGAGGLAGMESPAEGCEGVKYW